MLQKSYKFGFGIIVSLGLGGCSVTGPAPVYDLSAQEAQSKFESNNPSNKSAIRHQVKPGETLFSIAWRYSLDHKQIAQLNNVNHNRIYPGQILNLKAQSKQAFDPQSLVTAINEDFLDKKTPTPKAKAPVYRSANKVNKPSNPKTTSPKSKKPVNSRRVAASSNPVKAWIWPVNGKVINRFSKNSVNNKGVDIAAKKGSPVRATAKGRVVYSGNGLRGYGHLVIIKHNDKFLSAYAHNDKIHVQENEFVKAGQKIADLGSSGSDREKLHFEIRYKGKPVDPLNYLPKSGLF
jgi:lipoprotein NlpD